jgi:hypothetical protein
MVREAIDKIIAEKTQQNAANPYPVLGYAPSYQYC